jgi:hypothetical protein
LKFPKEENYGVHICMVNMRFGKEKKKKKFSLCDVGFGILDLKLKLERKVIKWLAGFFYFFW